ncbi:cellulase family glycosylhydrolase [Nakamurella sp. YIM 132087]|uniref:Endoglucanase n=1 Tax=Nakamurella alba TaxID=2665158 RepID=A0A7K1FKW5_9ACTN|nr:cellulase family glycosylhydrolase [Nakamurella alba]MTD14797.1 cellulase family glycosylhydrolase [Nakamurella alba]
MTTPVPDNVRRTRIVWLVVGIVVLVAAATIGIVRLPSAQNTESPDAGAAGAATPTGTTASPATTAATTTADTAGQVTSYGGHGSAVAGTRSGGAAPAVTRSSPAQPSDDTPRVDAATGELLDWEGPLHTEGSTILDVNDRPVRIRMANWFGLEITDCAPHGLWQISLDQGMAELAAFGFTTVRVPWSNECLDKPATSFDPGLNPELTGRTGIEVLDAVVAAAKDHGLTVLLDRHRPDVNTQSELWYTDTVSEQQWIDDWVRVVERYADDTTVIGADLHNEPHGAACWGCGDPARDWAAAAVRGGNAVLAANPDLLIVVEGVEKPGDGSTTWWGGGLSDVATHPISLSVPGRLVYSPHDYPSTIWPRDWFDDPAYPANLAPFWDRNWGFIQQQGIAPVLLGEFGSKLETESDKVWMATLVEYLNTNRMSFGYWAFNPNSGDTGGLVQDDWITPETAKLQMLAPLLGSEPDPQVPAPVTPAATTATTGAATTTAATGAAEGPDDALSIGWKQPSTWGTGYTVQLEITATVGVTGWSVSWPDGHAIGVADPYGMSCAAEIGVITCTGADWAGALGAGQSVTVGVQVNGDGTAPESPPLTVHTSV